MTASPTAVGPEPNALLCHEAIALFFGVPRNSGHCTQRLHIKQASLAKVPPSVRSFASPASVRRRHKVIFRRNFCKITITLKNDRF
jgi:hypothetical protein